MKNILICFGITFVFATIVYVTSFSYIIGIIQKEHSKEIKYMVRKLEAHKLECE